MAIQAPDSCWHQAWFIMTVTFEKATLGLTHLSPGTESVKHPSDKINQLHLIDQTLHGPDWLLKTPTVWLSDWLSSIRERMREAFNCCISDISNKVRQVIQNQTQDISRSPFSMAKSTFLSETEKYSNVGFVLGLRTQCGAALMGHISWSMLWQFSHNFYTVLTSLPSIL